MATITLTTTAQQDARIVAAFTVVLGYTGQLPDGTPETQGQFVRRKIIEFVTNTVAIYEGNQAAANAQAAALANVKSQVTPT